MKYQPTFRIGNLRGCYGYNSDVWGIGFKKRAFASRHTRKLIESLGSFIHWFWAR